jgi:hypothetical protein
MAEVIPTVPATNARIAKPNDHAIGRKTNLMHPPGSPPPQVYIEHSNYWPSRETAFKIAEPPGVAIGELFSYR